MNAEQVTGSYLGDDVVEKQKMQELKIELSTMDETQRLVQGLSLKKLKKKYQMTSLTATADDELREEMRNAGLAVMIDTEENADEFLREKVQGLAELVPEEKKALRGWGSWAGVGVREKKQPTVEEVLQRKLNKIQEIQRQRRDA